MPQAYHDETIFRTLGDYVRWGASRLNEAEVFFGHGTDNAVDEALVIVLHALHLSYPIPDYFWQTHLTAEEQHRIVDLFNQRIRKRCPTPYLTHEAWFANLAFYVDERVLIPRSPIAELIEQSFAPWIQDPMAVSQVLDLCTGSGCIAIAMALHCFPNAQVDATDISPEALTVAAKNIERFDLAQQVQLLQSDVFAQLPSKRYDLIVSNPPYVDAVELNSMPIEFHHEPRLGLEAGADGLDIVRNILCHAADYLTPEGVLVVEVGVSQAALERAYPNAPFTWVSFARGGTGVFVLTAAQLTEYVR